jgi:WD40 repeat protein
VSEISYLDFDIEIDRAATGYRVEINSPAGQSTGLFQPPFSDLELENFLLKLGQSRRAMRRMEQPETEAAKAFGARLFDAVFAGDVRACLRSSLDEASRQGKGLRLRLRLTDAPELADLPWEYLYHSALNRFLALSVNTPIVRYLELPERITPLAIEPPLRVLALIASPRDMPALDVEREWQRLNEALGGLIARGLVTLERVEQPSLLGLQQRLRRARYHILHFIGHGGFDTRSQDGELLLEDADGSGYRISGQDLGMLLHDHRSLRLVVLNACEGARASRTDPFAGAAQSLVQQGLPAVIAMQFEVSDEAAIALARDFYGALADGYPVDAALSEARKTLFASGSGVEWGTPVLYLRAPDGRIFSMPQASSSPAAGENTRRTLLPHPPDPPASNERVLDAALPEQVVVNQTIELVTQIRRADAPGLRALLGQPGANFEARPDDVRSSTFVADFPRNALGQPQPLDLLLAVESTDFSTVTPRQHIRLSPANDSEPVVFLITPLHPGELRLLIRVYLADSVLLASGFLKISGISQLAEGLRPLKRLLTLSLGTFGIGSDHIGAIGMPASSPDLRQPEPKFSGDTNSPRPTRPPESENEAKPAEQSAPREAARPPGRMPWLNWLAPLVTVLVIALVAGAVYQRINLSNNPSATSEPAVTSLPAQATEPPATTEPSAQATLAPTIAPMAEPTSSNPQIAAPPVTTAPEPSAAPTEAPLNSGMCVAEPLHTFALDDSINSVAVSPKGDYIAAGGEKNSIYIWDARTYELVQTLRQPAGRNNSVSSLAFSPDDTVLASAGAGNDILLWPLARPNSPVRLGGRQGHTGKVQSLAFSPNGLWLASGANDKTVKIWRLNDSIVRYTFRGHTNPVWGLAFAPDSRSVVSGAFDQNNSIVDADVRLWELRDNNPLQSTYAGATGGITSVAFSNDGTKLAAGSVDSFSYLWNIEGQNIVGAPEKNGTSVQGITFSPNDQLLATADSNGDIRLLSARDNSYICAYKNYPGIIRSVAFLPDGQSLVSGSSDQTVRIWGIAR